MNINFNFRKIQLTRLQNYLKDANTEITMMLQNLQWDRKHLAEQRSMIACQYNSSHRVPLDKLLEHENECFLKSQGYTEGDRLLPSPVDTDAVTLVKLDADNIAEIINKASRHQSSFLKVLTGPFRCDRIEGAGCGDHQPLTYERLQATYTSDERRAIHDAVVSKVPSCHDLSDLALLSTKDVGEESKTKSKLEILAELRDMRRRRTKYRVAAKTRNYSDVLRDVISTQMELYNEVHPSSAVPSTNSNETAVNNEDKNTAKCRDLSTTTKSTHNGSQSEQRKEHEIRKRRHSDLDSGGNSARSPRTQKREDHTNHDRKLKRRDDRDISAKADRARHPHRGRYDRRSRPREKEYDRRVKPRIEELSNNATRDRDRRSDSGKLKGKYLSRERHHSGRVKEDLRNNDTRKLSHKSRDNLDRRSKYN